MPVQEPTVDELTTVHGRLIMINPKVPAGPAAQYPAAPAAGCAAFAGLRALRSRLPSILPSARLVAPQDETSGFAQLTVRIPSAQRFAAYDKAGKLVAGDPEQVRGWWHLGAGLAPT